jgi:hypothetical protein
MLTCSVQDLRTKDSRTVVVVVRGIVLVTCGFRDCKRSSFAQHRRKVRGQLSTPLDRGSELPPRRRPRRHRPRHHPHQDQPIRRHHTGPPRHHRRRVTAIPPRPANQTHPTDQSIRQPGRLHLTRPRPQASCVGELTHLAYPLTVAKSVSKSASRELRSAGRLALYDRGVPTELP